MVKKDISTSLNMYISYILISQVVETNEKINHTYEIYTCVRKLNILKSYEIEVFIFEMG